MFRFRIFEILLLSLVKGKFTNSRIAILIPPHHSYKNPAPRIAKKKSLRLYANLYDYNDWKAYWNLKEVERERLYQKAKNAAVIIDIGTNNGWVLMNMASLVAKHNGFVYGFEPHPETYKRCIANIKSSCISNCEVYNMGCGEKQTEFVMAAVKESNSGQNRIITNVVGTHEAGGLVTIKVAKLDNMFAHLKKIDLIKIDVEGFEMHVLKGAEEILKKHRPVLFIEIDDELLRSNNTSPESVIVYLENSLGYSILNAADEQRIAHGFSFANCHLDIICLPS